MTNPPSQPHQSASPLDYSAILATLKSVANPKNIEGMARFGINPKNTLGISIPVLRKLAKQIGKNHQLAVELYDSGIHEARMLAAFIDDPTRVTEQQAEDWVNAFDSWDVCDQVVSNLFDKTSFAFQKAQTWASQEEEFVKRAGFVMMASLAVHDKKAGDDVFAAFFPLIKRGATDERNFVRKAVNWALRQIGKRNADLHRMACELALEIQRLDSKAAKWIAADALRELQSAKVGQRLSR